MNITHFDFERWQKNFDDNTIRLNRLLERNASARPEQEGWSAAQCIEHLRVTGLAYLPAWNRIQAERGDRPGGRYAIWWRWFLGAMRNPKKIRVRTPAPFNPNSNPNLAGVVAEYCIQRGQILQLAGAMWQTQKGGYSVTSPFAAWMKYPNDFAFDLWLAHEDRHLTQAESTQSIVSPWVSPRT